MSIVAISSSPASPATTGTAATRPQTAASGSADTNFSATLASTNLQLNAKAQALISKLKQQAPESDHPAGKRAASDASYTYSPNSLPSASTDNVQIPSLPGQTPEAAVARAHAIEAAALASAYPSNADLAVAVQAQQLAAQAQSDLAAQQAQNPQPAGVAAAPSPVPATIQTNTASTVNTASSVSKAYGAQPAIGPSLDTYA